MADPINKPSKPDAIIRDKDGKLWFVDWKLSEGRGEFDTSPNKPHIQVRIWRKLFGSHNGKT